MGLSLWHLLIVLVIVVLLFGTKKLRSIGGDLGGAIKGFRESLSGEKDQDSAAAESKQLSSNETTPAATTTKSEKEPQSRG